MIVASPGLLCSVSDAPSRRAITVWRSACSCPPKTVEELRPLDSSFACASCSRPMASKDSFFTVFAFRLVAPVGGCELMRVLASFTLPVTLHGCAGVASSNPRPVLELTSSPVKTEAVHRFAGWSCSGRTPSRSGSTGGSARMRWPAPPFCPRALSLLSPVPWLPRAVVSAGEHVNGTGRSRPPSGVITQGVRGSPLEPAQRLSAFPLRRQSLGRRRPGRCPPRPRQAGGATG